MSNLMWIWSWQRMWAAVGEEVVNAADFDTEVM